ncbi:MAG: FRG domain-containing protein [Pseudomonadota bacterium]
MEKIGNNTLWSFVSDHPEIKRVRNPVLRRDPGHFVKTYFELAAKIAELQFHNRDHVILFRGQSADYPSSKGGSMLKASIFRHASSQSFSLALLKRRFKRLEIAERYLVDRYNEQQLLGRERIMRHRILRWSVLQHYEVCDTPLLDVTNSLRVAASFASHHNSSDAFLFAIAVPNLSGAITASSEAGMQIVRLSSACPPNAIRPHVQEGYLLGEYPEIVGPDQSGKYSYYEMDFGRRLLGKFRFKPTGEFWHSENYTMASEEALYPKQRRDPMLLLTREIKEDLPSL